MLQQSQPMIPNASTVRIYGCGGGGINFTKHYRNGHPAMPGVAHIQTCYIDTSRSNLDDLPEDASVFVLPELDGSGKIRKENHEPIAQVVPKILKDFMPGDFNIVVFTASGGTGSVAGPLLLSELLLRGHRALAVVVGSHESVITGTNTFNTLKSLDHLARSRRQSIVSYYTSNTRDRKLAEVDKEIQFTISSLLVLMSGQNNSLDSKDLAHWIDFGKATSVPHQLALLSVYNDREQVEAEAREAFSLASLLKSKEEMDPDLFVQYGTTGYLPRDCEVPYNLYFAIETESLRGVLAHLNTVAAQSQEIKSSRIEAPTLVAESDEISNTGLIL